MELVCWKLGWLCTAPFKMCVVVNSASVSGTKIVVYLVMI